MSIGIWNKSLYRVTDTVWCWIILDAFICRYYINRMVLPLELRELKYTTIPGRGKWLKNHLLKQKEKKSFRRPVKQVFKVTHTVLWLWLLAMESLTLVWNNLDQPSVHCLLLSFYFSLTLCKLKIWCWYFCFSLTVCKLLKL